MNSIEDNLKDMSKEELIKIIDRQEGIINKACLYISQGKLIGSNVLDIKKELTKGLSNE